MDIEIIPIGTGNAFTKTGFETNYIVRCGKTSLLVDCGTTASRALAALDCSLLDFDHVYISHLHLDHVGGLVELGMLRHLKQLPKPKIYAHERLLPQLWDDYLGTFLGKFMDRNKKAATGGKETFFTWQPIPAVFEANDEVFQLGDLQIRLVAVPHVPGMVCHGVILNDRIFVSTDVTYQPELLERIANAFAIEAMFHDCSVEVSRGVVHAAYEELLTLPEDLRELLILTHYEDSALERTDFELAVGEAGKSYIFP